MTNKTTDDLITQQAKDIASLRKLVTVLERRVQRAELETRRAKSSARKNTHDIAVLTNAVNRISNSMRRT